MELINLANPISWLIIVAIIIYWRICWTKMLNGLYLIVLLLPSYLLRFTIFGVPVTFLEILILIAFVSWLFKDKRLTKINWRWQKNPNNPIPGKYRWPLSLLLIAATISAVIAPDQIAAWGIWKAYFLEPAMFFLMVMYTVKERREIYRFLDILGLLAIVFFGMAMFQKITGWGIPNDFWAAAETRRITTILGYPNANALLIAPIVALFLGYWRETGKYWQQAFKALVIIGGFLTIWWAQSAGALLGLAVAIIILMISHKKTRSLAIAMVIVAIMIPLNTASIKFSLVRQWHNIQAQTLSLDASSLEIRANQWQETWQLLISKPQTFILGPGLATYQSALVPFHRHNFIEIFLYPHNILLNFWTETGLSGAIGFCWLLILLFIALAKQIWRKKIQPLGWALLLAFITIVVHGLVDVPYFKNDLSVLFWLLTALAIISARRVKV